MKLRVIWTGKTRNRELAVVLAGYADRIGHFIGFDIVELKEPRTTDDAKRITGEAEKILARIGSTDHVVALDDGGQPHTSSKLAEFVENHMKDGQRDLVFVVGGPAGLSTRITERANLLLSLSPLTFSHDLARTVLLEQIYRALTIIRNVPYAR